MTKQITIYADYVCPYCLLAGQVIEEVIQGQAVEIEWRPFELRPEPVPTLRVEDPYLPQVWKESVYPMAEQMGVPIKLPALSPQPRTTKAFELLAMAQDQGLAHRYSMRAMQAFFQEERDIGDPKVLIELAAEAGLKADDARQALVSGTYTERHREALRHAREDRAISAVPTIILGTQVFRGIPTPDELRRAIAKAVRGPDNSTQPHGSMTE